MDVERIIDYLSPAARREVLRVVRQVQEVSGDTERTERCPNPECGSDDPNTRYDVDTGSYYAPETGPCDHPWHRATDTEGESGG